MGSILDQLFLLFWFLKPWKKDIGCSASKKMKLALLLGKYDELIYIINIADSVSVQLCLLHVMCCTVDT